MRKSSLYAAILYTSQIAPAAATPCVVAVSAKFSTGAPSDVMSLRNISSPGWHVTHALFDLGPSHGALIFDTAEGPPGAGGAYNFEQTGGEAALFSLPYIIDGAEILTLLFTGFAPGASLNFMIDLDARLGGSGANVSARDVAGARLQVTLRDARGAAAQLEGAFSAQGLLALRTKCPK